MKNLQWYKEIWTLDIKNQSWVEDTPIMVYSKKEKNI
jgi:hypothetical protein